MSGHKAGTGSTSARSAANARNAQHSTGPKTEAGKRRASRNARRHGLSAGTADETEAASLLAMIKADWPDGFAAANATIFEALASTQARLARAGALEAAAVKDIAAHAVKFGDESAMRDRNRQAARQCRDMALEAHHVPIGRYSAEDFRFMGSVFSRALSFDPACTQALDELRRLSRYTRDGEALRRKLIKALAGAARDNELGRA